MATAIYITGLEWGLSPPGSNGGGLVTAITGVSPQIQVIAAAARTGGYGLHIAPTASLAARFDSPTWTAAGRIVGSVYVKASTLPTADYVILHLETSSGDILHPAIVFNYSTTKFAICYANSDNTSISAKTDFGSVTISAGSWYRIDFDFLVNSTTWALKAQLDGAGEQTYSPGSMTSDTLINIRFGHSGASGPACTWYFDDVIISATSGDYPIGAHAVVGLSPNAAGTSNPHPTVTNIQNNSSSTIDDDTLPANVYLDEVPFGTTTDYVKQVGGTSSIYAAVAFADTAQTSILGVMAYEAYHSASASPANSASARVYDGTTETAIYTGDMSESSLFYKSKIMPNPGGGWTMALVNGIQGRVGFATDYAPVPYWDTLMLEVAYSTAAVSYVLQTTTGSFALSGSNAILLFKRLTKVTAGAFALTGNNAKLYRSIKIQTTVGAFVLSGSNANLRAARKTFTTAGAFTESGQNALLRATRQTCTVAGSYAWAGNNGVLARGYPLKTTVGAFSLSGSNAYLLRASKMYSTSGTFTWSGSNAILKSTHLVKTTTGGFAWVGNDAILTYVPVGGGAYLLQTTSGSFVLSGSNAYLRYYRKTFTTVGAFTWTGNNSVILAARKTFTTAGTYTLTGNNALLREGRLIKTTTGAFTFTGNNAILVFVRKILSGAGVYTWTGNNVTLTYTSIAPTYQLLVSKGIFILTGKDVIFYKFGNLPTIERTYIVPAEDRTFDVEYEDRTFEVMEEIRTIIETENRTYLVEAENRIVEVTDMEDVREFEKGPGEVLDYVENWTTWLGADTIATSSWSVPAGITKASDNKTNTLATIWLVGGTLPEIYPCVNTITTAGGRTAIRTINIIMVPR